MTALDHRAEAERLLEVATAAHDGTFSTAAATAAQVHATLYVAEQQRMANLIAVAIYDEQSNLPRLKAAGLLEDPVDADPRILRAVHEGVGKSFAQIREGLGLS